MLSFIERVRLALYYTLQELKPKWLKNVKTLFPVTLEKILCIFVFFSSFVINKGNYSGELN